MLPSLCLKNTKGLLRFHSFLFWVWHGIHPSRHCCVQEALKVLHKDHSPPHREADYSIDSPVPSGSRTLTIYISQAMHFLLQVLSSIVSTGCFRPVKLGDSHLDFIPSSSSFNTTLILLLLCLRNIKGGPQTPAWISFLPLLISKWHIPTAIVVPKKH